MLSKVLKLGSVFCVILASTTSTVQAADITDPLCTFGIVIKQGGVDIVNDTVSIGLGGELDDLKPIFADGTPEDHTQIGIIGPATDPIILKVTTEGTPGYRLTHWYIEVPLSMADIDLPGPTSLFDPTAGLIDVIITGIEFGDGALMTPRIEDNGTFLTSFMRDKEGHFYELPGSNPAGPGAYGHYDVQVPGEKYHDGDLSAYTFDILSTGLVSSWKWGNIIPPDLTTTVAEGSGVSDTPVEPGYVFELGTAVAFVAIPEPSTLGLLAIAAISVIKRRRR